VTIPAGYTPARVAVIRPRGLGDIVLCSAVVEALHRAYPRAAIDFVAERPARGLLECDARLDGTFLLDPGPRSTRRAAAWLRARRPDVAIDLFSNPRTAILTALSGARYRVGLDKRLRRLVYNVRVPRHLGSRHGARWAAEVQLDFLRGAGISWPGTAAPSVAVTPADRAAAAAALDRLGLAGHRFGAVLPGGSWESKRWSVPGFGASARELAARTGHPALVAWGPPERTDAEAIVAAAGGSAVLAPPTSLREMAALLAHPALLVVTDCLARHFAVVQGTPTIGLFGTTDPRDWTPPRGPHRTLRGGPEQGYASLRDFPAEPVLAAIREHFAEPSLDTSHGAP